MMVRELIEQEYECNYENLDIDDSLEVVEDKDAKSKVCFLS